MSVEAIYQALYVQGVGSLAQELKREKALRSGRKNRIPRSRLAGLPGRGRKTWVEGAQISMRPPQASDRAVPGHWEGDLVVGGGKDGHGTALITLVERRSRFVLMHRLGAGRDSKTVVDELVTMVKSLPGKFERGCQIFCVSGQSRRKKIDYVYD
ncbi:IS30 family transposase [Arcanobacterium wilhelmae]|uniref:IS30 family transposase n=1 Tax=Arcanobacterium wilhelmae TaxID=1803177 RepID=A0ABT9N9L2_9ACTO|nr:IS30 family transposase [Arcanobacterium wilhelmae]